MLPPPVWVALVVGLVWAAVRRKRVLLALAAGAVVWTAIVAAMAQRGYAGLPRYLWMACALEACAGGRWRRRAGGT